MTRPSVDLTLAGTDEDVLALRASLNDALSNTKVELHVTRLSEIEPRSVSRAQPAARRVPHLWVDAALANQATLYLTSADGSHVFVRHFELERGLDPVALELLGLVARSSLEAMLAGDRVGVSREEYERSLPAAKSPSEPPASKAPGSTKAASAPDDHPFRLGALYELEGLAASTLQHGVGVQFEWRPRGFSLGLSAALRAPLQVGSGALQVRLVSRSTQLFVGLPMSLSERATLAIAAAYGVDWIRVEGIERAQNATPEAAYSVADSVFRALVSFRYRLGPVELGAGFGAELGLSDARYYLLRGEQREAVFTPWRVRPLGTLGLAACF